MIKDLKKQWKQSLHFGTPTAWKNSKNRSTHWQIQCTASIFRIGVERNVCGQWMTNKIAAQTGRRIELGLKGKDAQQSVELFRNGWNPMTTPSPHRWTDDMNRRNSQRLCIGAEW